MLRNRSASLLGPGLSAASPVFDIHAFHVTRMDPGGQTVLSITGNPCNVRRAGVFWRGAGGGGGSCLLPSAELTSRSRELGR